MEPFWNHLETDVSNLELILYSFWNHFGTYYSKSVTDFGSVFLEFGTGFGTDFSNLEPTLELDRAGSRYEPTQGFELTQGFVQTRGGSKIQKSRRFALGFKISPGGHFFLGWLYKFL